MFEEKGVKSERKQSKMFQSPERDVTMTGHYNRAGTIRGVGLAPKVGSMRESDKSVVPTKSEAFKCSDFIK
jgi:hypothetical protein